MPYKDPDKKREYARVAARTRRAEAKKEGVVLPSDDWFRRNPEKNSSKTRRWRAANPERSKEAAQRQQAKRRSTPWGIINNRMWPTIHSGVRRGSTRQGKYNKALGYTWLDLRQHLEAQFTESMSWDNWGIYWELDHIAPLSSFRYESIECPTFKTCWGLENLRPLLRESNRRKGSKQFPPQLLHG